MQTNRPAFENTAGAPSLHQTGSSPLFLWLCLALWIISFVFPAATYTNFGQEEKMRGWEAAFTALLFFFVPVKGMLFAFDPHTWAGLLNLFMLGAPFEIKRIRRGQGRVYTSLFLFATAIPIGLLFIPRSADLASINTFESGFYLWTLSLCGAAAWCAWAVWRRWVALIPGILAIPLLLFGSLRHQQTYQSWLQQQTVGQQNGNLQERWAAEADAEKAIAERGLTAFDEPLKGQEEITLQLYLGGPQPFAPDQLIAASEHYRTPGIMETLATRKDCPAAALEILYEHALSDEHASASGDPSVGHVYWTIAQNANAPANLLVKMIESDSPRARTAAVLGPKLPAKAKAAYLKKGCDLSDEDRNAVARQPDTPLDVMECLAAKPAARFGLADNPNTPLAVLENMSVSTDPAIAQEGKQALAKRQQKLP